MPGMNPRVQIAGRWIGEGSPCFIVAEAGSNHNGRLDQAQRLIEVAAQAGADAVKFQLFRADRLYPRTAGRCDYLKEDRPIYDLIQEMEMPYDWLPLLAQACQERGLIFLCSVFDEESADRLDPHVPAHKIASYEMTHLPLVRHIAGKTKPVLMATGTAHLDEVREAVEAFRREGNPNLVLLQCTAAYPAPLDSLNIRAVSTLRQVFGVATGLSDHSRDPLVGPMAAVAVGARVIEKHFTLDNDAPGPDHRFALEPEELRRMIQKIREVEQALGDGRKVAQPVEAELRGFARRAVFAIKNIAQGQAFDRRNVAVLRTGKQAPGALPRDWDRLLGRPATRSIPAGSPVQQGDWS